MTIAEQKYELLNINCMLLNIATIRQPQETDQLLFTSMAVDLNQGLRRNNVSGSLVREWPSLYSLNFLFEGILVAVAVVTLFKFSVIKFVSTIFTKLHVSMRKGRADFVNKLFFLFRASGKILKAYAQDFESLSQDGHMFVIVQNTGYVTADFAVSLNLLLNINFLICLQL